MKSYLNRRKNVPIIFISFLLVFLSEILPGSEKMVTLDLKLKYFPEEFHFRIQNGFDVIYHHEMDFLSEIGRPMLPVQYLKYAIPDGIKVTDVKIVEFNTEELGGKFNILPAQPPIAFEQDAHEFINPEPNIYNSDTVFPEKSANLRRQADLAGQSYIVIEICPLQYIPSDKKISIINEITLRIEGEHGYVCGDYLPPNLTKTASDGYLKRLKRIIYNKDEIDLKSDAGRLMGLGPLPDGGPYDYIIITADSMTGYFSPLASWRTQTGLKATSVSTEHIYENYYGASSLEKIRNFIIDAHQTWGTLYFLMGGDETVVPLEYRFYYNGDIPGDTYYSDYDDDWEYEVYVGRITAQDSTDITRFCNKVIKYETYISSAEFPLNITLFGMDMLTIPGDPSSVIHIGRIVKDSIDINILPPYLNVTKIYDEDAGNHKEAFINAIDEGQNVFNHVEHGGNTNLAVGWDQHNWMFFDYELYDLTNYHKYLNMFTTGCHTAHIDYPYRVISESFILLTDSTGAVSWVGNTRNGWTTYPTEPIKYTNALDYYWQEGLYSQNVYRAGEILAYSKSVSTTDIYFPYCEWELLLLGDPAMPLWNNAVSQITASHSEYAEAVPADFDIHVETISGIPIENALVCLWSTGQDYQKGHTNSNGDITINFWPTTGDPVIVTVTGQNILPYQGEIEITGNLPPQCISPGDTVVLQCEPGDISLQVGCFDPDGNLETGPTLLEGPGYIQDGYWVYYAAGPDSFLITIGCTDSLGYSLESSFIVLIDFNDTPQITFPNDTTVEQEWPAEMIILPVMIIDENTENIFVLQGFGTINDGYWKYLPEFNIEGDIVIEAVDGCGVSAQETFHIACIVNNICGDINKDNSVNILDIIALINFLYKGGNPPDPYYVGDVDGSIVVNILDITYLINYLYKGGPEPICQDNYRQN